MNGARIRFRGAVAPLASYAAAAVLLPAAALADDRTPGIVAAVAIGLVLSTGTAVALARRVRHSTFALLGGSVVAGAGWLLPQTDPSPVTWLLSTAIGVAVGLGVGGLVRAGVEEHRTPIALGAGVGVAQVVLLVGLDGAHAPAPAGALLAVAMVLVRVLEGRAPRTARPRWPAAAVGAAVAVTVGTGLWIGANSPTATWFGSQVSHGPRDRDRVAITFDDGPNVPYSERIAAVLDEHGAEGTFFLVGKALEAGPGVARRLMADGHLLANHSYHHDSWRWLDPRYPELERTQDAFRRTLGVCPTFFRAPHGQHTPFMARVVGDHGMTMVGWDVSAGDWKSTDERRVAERVLEQVEPGSIIVLHDGLDGDVTADRSVLVRALPLILDGLERRGIEAVGLDTLLGEEGYGDHC